MLPNFGVGPWNESQLSYFIISTGLLFENVAGMRLEDIVGAVSGPDYSHGNSQVLICAFNSVFAVREPHVGPAT